MTTQRRRAGQKLRTGSGAWERLVNSQQRSLVRAYDKWAVDLRDTLLRLQNRGAAVGAMEAAVRGAAPRLAENLFVIAQKGVEASVAVSVGRSMRGTPFVANAVKSLVTNAQDLIRNALVPGMVNTLVGKLRGGEFDAGRRAMVAAFGDLRYRPANYAGGAWAAIFEVQKTVGVERNRERATEGLPPEPVRWVLDPQAIHCADSPGFLGCPPLAGEYPSWDVLPTVPAGRTTCRGNCRCEIEVFVDGVWRRGFGN